MPRRKKRVVGVTTDYMRAKLAEWNPHWNSQTIEGYAYDQLVAIYMKEQRKVMVGIYANLGLEY